MNVDKKYTFFNLLGFCGVIYIYIYFILQQHLNKTDYLLILY